MIQVRGQSYLIIEIQIRGKRASALLSFTRHVVYFPNTVRTQYGSAYDSVRCVSCNEERTDSDWTLVPGFALRFFNSSHFLRLLSHHL